MKNSLGDRMKKYEDVSRISLTRRNPIIIRIDGKAFHTFTRGFEKPFDRVFMSAMQRTTKYLCENIMNCKVGFTQSDEISLLLMDYDYINTEAWFGNNLQKIVSVSASMATMAFNKIFKEEIEAWWEEHYSFSEKDLILTMEDIYDSKIGNAMFDSRAFIIPVDEVCNYFIWRQKDAERNSILSVAQANFSHKELQGISCDKLQDKLFVERGINWNDFSIPEKRGTSVIRTASERVDGESGPVNIHPIWVIDYDTPIFTQDRFYIEQWLTRKD